MRQWFARTSLKGQKRCLAIDNCSQKLMCVDPARYVNLEKMTRPRKRTSFCWHFALRLTGFYIIATRYVRVNQIINSNIIVNTCRISCMCSATRKSCSSGNNLDLSSHNHLLIRYPTVPCSTWPLQDYIIHCLIRSQFQFWHVHVWFITKQKRNTIVFSLSQNWNAAYPSFAGKRPLCL